MAKSIVFAVLALLLVYGAIEAGVYMLYGLTNPYEFSFRDTRNKLEEIRNNRRVEMLMPSDKENRRRPALHPYLGFGPPLNLYDYAQDKNELVVGIVGASVAQNLCRDQEAMQHMRDILSRIEAWRGRPIRIACLALSSYKQPQQSIAAQIYIAFGGRLDVLINLDGHNDTIDARFNQLSMKMFYGYPYAMVWQGTTLPLRSQKDSQIAVRIVAMRLLRQKWAELFLSFPGASHSVSLMVLWEYGDRVFRGRIHDYEEAAMGDGSKPKLNGPYTHLNEKEILQRTLHTWMEGSYVINDLARRHGFHYYHFLQPLPNLQNTKPINEEERRSGVQDDHERMLADWAYPEMMRNIEVLRAQGVKAYDLTMIFKGKTQTLYIDACCHVNHAGNMIFADTIATHIAQDMSSNTR